GFDPASQPTVANADVGLSLAHVLVPCTQAPITAAKQTRACDDGLPCYRGDARVLRGRQRGWGDNAHSLCVRDEVVHWGTSFGKRIGQAGISGIWGHHSSS